MIRFKITKYLWKDMWNGTTHDFIKPRDKPVNQYTVILELNKKKGTGIDRSLNKPSFWKALYRAYQDLEIEPKYIFGHLPNNIKVYTKHPTGLHGRIDIDNVLNFIDSQITVKENGN